MSAAEANTKRRFVFSWKRRNRQASRQTDRQTDTQKVKRRVDMGHDDSLRRLPIESRLGLFQTYIILYKIYGTDIIDVELFISGTERWYEYILQRT